MTRNVVSNQAGGTRAESGGGEGLIVPVHTTHSHITPLHGRKNSSTAIPELFQHFHSLQKVMQRIISAAEKKKAFVWTVFAE